MQHCTHTTSWRALHQRICEGDDDAFTQLDREIRPRLRHWLRRQLLRWDEDLIENSITDALKCYYDAPTRFATGGSSLWSYLHGMTHNHFLHNLRSETRRLRREDLVLLDPEKIDLEEPLSLYTHLDTTELDACRQRLDELVLRLSPTERDEVVLMRDGVQEVEAWACLLPLTALPRLRQRTKIKFEKVRIRRKLRRLAVSVR